MCFLDDTLRKRRILCVDDERDVCDLMKVLLGGCGYDVACSTTLADGLSLAANRCFDLYLLDVVLKDGSGLDLARLIRAFDPCAPLVFLSGRAFPKTSGGAWRPARRRTSSSRWITGCCWRRSEASLRT